MPTLPRAVLPVRSALAAALLLAAAPSSLAQSAPVGDWGGVLPLDATTDLPFVLHVTAPDGALAVALDIPAQNAYDLQADRAELRGDSLVVQFSRYGLAVNLAVGPDSLRGTFAQGSFGVPVALGRVEVVPLVRPQTPVGPFPYTTTEVAVESEPGVTLAGTFVVPAGDGPFPGVVFLTGSGAQDRDESLFGHRPHAVLADALARAGVASLRVDDRGAGASTGAYATATMDALLRDARATAGWLAARGEVRTVGAVGHSQGGLTALRMAGDVDFVVLMAAPVLRMDRIMAVQNERVRRAQGMDSAAAAQIGQAAGAAFTALADHAAEPDSVLAPRLLRTAREAFSALPPATRAAEGLADAAGVEARAASVVASLLAPGYRSLFAYDPAPDLAALATPTLALFGSRDVQVPADLNAPVLAPVLAGIPGSETIVVPDANHLFQTTTTGSVADYGELEETMNPQVVQAVVAWIVDMARLDD